MYQNDELLTEYKLNDVLTLKNKIVMAPMTRAMATDAFVPTQAMADYYARRADAGLIVTEGVIIGKDASGYRNVPGLFNQSQVDAWQKVTTQVHANGGKIFAQIWHVGRVSHPELKGGQQPISASATTMTGRISRGNGLMYGESRAATRDEIDNIIKQYADAAIYAMRAGFDGIEIHGANGYLVDQFLHYHTNLRTDEYGGSPENMARFAMEVVMACGEVIGYERVGLRLSPGAYLNEIKGDVRDSQVFSYLLQELNKLAIAYVHTGNFNDADSYAELGGKTMTQFIRQHYTGTLIASGGYTLENARLGLSQGQFNLIAFGRSFIANPDLVQRIQENSELAEYDNNMLNRLH